MTPKCVRELPLEDMKGYITRLVNGTPPKPGNFTTTDAMLIINRVRNARKVVADFNGELTKVLESARQKASMTEAVFHSHFDEFLEGGSMRCDIETKYTGTELNEELDGGVDVLPLTAKLALNKATAAIEKHIQIQVRAKKSREDILAAMETKVSLEKLSKVPAGEFPMPDKGGSHLEYQVQCANHAFLCWDKSVKMVTGLRFLTETEIKDTPNNAFDRPLVGDYRSSTVRVFLTAQLDMGATTFPEFHIAESAAELVSYVCKSQTGEVPGEKEHGALVDAANKQFTDLMSHFGKNQHPGRLEEIDNLNEANEKASEVRRAEQIKLEAALRAAKAAKAKIREDALAAKLIRANARKDIRKSGAWFTNEQLPDPNLTTDEQVDL